MRFLLAPRSMTSDDLELLHVRIFSEIRVSSQIWEATTAKRMKIDSYCQRQNCSPLNALFKVPCVDLPCISSLWAFIHALLSPAYLSFASVRLSC